MHTWIVKFVDGQGHYEEFYCQSLDRIRAIPRLHERVRLNNVKPYMVVGVTYDYTSYTSTTIYVELEEIQ